LESHPDQYADFACDLNLQERPEHAWIALTCGSWVSLWVNGDRVSMGPPREVAPWQYYDVVNLAEHLRPGVNRLRMRCYHFGVRNQFHEPCLAGVMIQGVVETSAGTVRLNDPRLWRSGAAEGFLPDAPRLNFCIGFGENRDLVIEPDAWLHQAPPSHWSEPAIVASHPLPGREKLISRDLPEMTGAIKRASFLRESGSWQVWDFGEETAGFLRLQIESKEPCVCEVLHGESITRRGLPDFQYHGGDYREILHLPVGLRRWESFDKRALRYVALPSGLDVRELSVREWRWPFIEVWRTTPAAKNLDDKERRIVAAAARTITLCADDLLNDTPRRERSQYNDPSLYMRAIPLLFGTWAPVRRWMNQYRRGAGPDGCLRMCYPSPAGHLVIPDFAIGYVRNIFIYGEASGDWETVRQCYSSAVASLESFKRYEDSNRLLTDVPGWIFLCNSFEVAKHPRSSGLNALYAEAWRLLADLAKRFGDERANEFSANHIICRESWRQAFLHDRRILCADSSPEHERHTWWNYHYEADRGFFIDEQSSPPPYALRIRWEGPSRSIRFSAAGSLRIWLNAQRLFDGKFENVWQRPYPFHPIALELPNSSGNDELVFEVGYNKVDWEILFEVDRGRPIGCEVIELPATGFSIEEIVKRPGRPAELRPWFSPQHSQISAGYAIACGMLEPAEAVPILRSCVREHYYVPWMKRTTPLIAEPTTDADLIRNRATLCNTPQSLYFFCEALRKNGMPQEARKLCRRIFGIMLDNGATTLWEEFAPRSSLCHAWSAVCVEHLLSN